MDDRGTYIKLYRKMSEWEWHEDPHTLSLFLHLLLLVNWEPKTWKGVQLKAGQTVTSREKLARLTGMTERQIRTCIERLKSTNEIAIETTKRFSLVTIVNWALYQSDEKNPPSIAPSLVPSTLPSRRHHDAIEMSITKEVKKERTIYSGKSDEWLEAMEAFREMRKSSKKPMTDRAEKLIVNELDRLTDDEDIQTLILNQSVMRCWQGVFPLKDTPQTRSRELEYTVDP